MRNPLTAPGVTTLRREMDRLFDRFWEGDDFQSMGDWTPAMDVSETRDTLTVRMEIPGIDPKDVHVNLENAVLTVRGEKRREADRESERFHRSERSYGSFVRSVRLPIPVDPSKVDATFQNGVLTVVMPKSAEMRGTEIPIRS